MAHWGFGKQVNSLRIFLAVIVATFTVPGQDFAYLRAAYAAPAAGQTYVVDSTIDAPDADTSDGICATTNGQCTLRAAIMQANSAITPVTIILPAGIYTLTRLGHDNNAFAGDLDITGNLTIQGAGPGLTIVDGNSAITHDRVFDIQPSASNVNITGMTIRDGNSLEDTYEDGGGIFLESNFLYGSPSLNLNDVLIEGNTATNGGGLSAHFGEVKLHNTLITANTAKGSGGGLYAQSSLMTIQDSKVYSNTANSGGGLELIDVKGQIERSVIFSNMGTLKGGGLEDYALSANPTIQVRLDDSSLHDNRAEYGGAIYSYTSLVISHTVIQTNTASMYGGGFYFAPNLFPSTVVLERSTLSQNVAQYGGGIYEDVPLYAETSQTRLTNTTLSGNAVSHDGGGIYATGAAHLSLLNTTIADNQLRRNFPQYYTLRGGGLVITATAIITAQNTLIGNNSLASGITFPTPDDCFGDIHSQGYNLIQDTDHCIISGTTSGNVTGQDPRLGPLQNNGGSTLTQALLTGSPAVDAGDNSACPATDQRGVMRPFDGDSNGSAICDIGAYEAASHLSQSITFAPITNKTIIDSPFVITATASSGLPVNFNTSPPGNCGVSGSSSFAGVSSATVTLSKVGNCILVAQQPGNPTFDPAVPVTQTFTTNPNLFLPVVVRLN